MDQLTNNASRRRTAIRMGIGVTLGICPGHCDREYCPGIGDWYFCRWSWDNLEEE